MSSAAGDGHGAADPAETRSPGGATVRVRLMAAVVALTATALTVAGATGLALQLRDVDARIDESLTRAVAAVRVLEAEGQADPSAPTEPEARVPWTSLDVLLRKAVESRIPGEHEGVVAFLGGEMKWRPADETGAIRLDTDRELMAWLADVGSDDGTDSGAPRPRTVTTGTTEYRLVAVPVRVDAQPAAEGLVVVAFDRSAATAGVRRIFLTYSAVGLFALAAVSVVAWFVVGRMLRPVRMLRDTVRRVTESDLSERIAVLGKDDLADLAGSVNAMLDRLERAFGSQRELLDDVGHELRTPLTIVRGHLELLDPSDAADVRATQALALDELDRMQRLVDDLVTLAIADRPDFVRPAPVDVGRLTDDVLEKARALGERRFVVVSRADVTARVDAQRITQAWLQLLANAVRFSAPGSTVRLGSEVAGGRLLLWVRDEGPGVPPEQEARIFERFHRGRADRVQHGAGLGLPIVAAIAAAHGGRVFLEHPPPGAGPGVVFVLDLPAVGLVAGASDVSLELVEQHR
ncbi:sensor histidine kinase [Cellulomonas shaoxiangyii]|uniref:histidine kinase n=1 Tax=Cellulomonas shaoxiangyii TaxID=2566013 RepID=A0A4P7SG54_9CELL|nr:HAMP domain-containing sensor histidine kinase [Cellulomonas shaoxiangyii]QCB92880.1 HAMP domain-containing histidine kinase [Cellulomonas shaoxiangyii]TGY81335.1 HAMP domain-containing histidine kinase [Cellulomonas shaoxiangyii]